MTGDGDPRPYRSGVGVMLMNPAGQVFVGRRTDTAEAAWQMPQGGIDPGEEPLAAALRELAEETGVPARLAEVVAETADWIAYDLPPELRDRVWKGRFRGQRQKWFLLRFLGADADVKLDAHHPAEFVAWRWVWPADLPELIVGFKQDLYRRVLAAFAPHLAG